MWVQYLIQEDPLEWEMAIHASIPWTENSMDRGAWWATVHKFAESDMTAHTHTSIQSGSQCNRILSEER